MDSDMKIRGRIQWLSLLACMLRGWSNLLGVWGKTQRSLICNMYLLHAAAVELLGSLCHLPSMNVPCPKTPKVCGMSLGAIDYVRILICSSQGQNIFFPEILWCISFVFFRGEKTMRTDVYRKEDFVTCHMTHDPIL